MRRALVTGGSRGIGKAICEKFEAEGYEVFKPSREELDLFNDESIDSFISKYSDFTFDVIVNNAGINPIDYIEDIKDEDFDMALQINVKAPYKIIQGFISGMKNNHYGRIINISSIWSIVSKEKRMTYSICKQAINGMTNALAVECGKHNILINSVCPGFVNTELTKKNISDEEAKKLAELIPLGRFAETSEIAETVFWLASEKNSYITGQKIVVDGGYVAK